MLTIHRPCSPFRYGQPIDHPEYRRGLAEAAVRIGSTHYRRVSVEEVAKAAGADLELVKAEGAPYRAGVVAAVLQIARAHFRPFVPVELLADTVGITHAELREAIGKAPRADPRSPEPPGPRRATQRTSQRAEGPSGTKWCAKGKHWVLIEDPETGKSGFGRNRARPDGLADYCWDHQRAYWGKKGKDPGGDNPGEIVDSL